MTSSPARTAGPVGEGSVPTVGVEEEFVLADPGTGAPWLDNVAVAAAGHEFGVDLQLELSRCQIETATPVCTNIAELRTQLRRARTGAAAAAACSGAVLLATAVPPLGPPPRLITDQARYRNLVENFGLLGEQVICGCHVHVAIPDRDAGVRVSNHLRPWLPALLALTANSPIADGRDTGYASWRHVLWTRWPNAGPPPRFESAQHYDAVVATMLEHRVILDTAMLYWDVRLSAHLPTIEVRIADTQATVDEAVLLATLVRGLVITALDPTRQGQGVSDVEPEVLRAAYWRAARDGLTGHGIDTESGRLVPAAHPITRLLEHVRPALERTGDYRSAREAVDRMLREGNGAARQRATFEEGTPADLVRFLACAPARDIA
ncbi:carboxylate-amine ligase [Rhodococcus phenolicus]|uniref:carboxylate-amine ligase n=1 Tax=Rhodococcus phenolicus TaxID=263849 RepID=UPI0008336E2E|nr:glutamate--cysteine ligase [Rhodococcus phenolicus]